MAVIFITHGIMGRNASEVCDRVLVYATKGEEVERKHCHREIIVITLKRLLLYEISSFMLLLKLVHVWKQHS